MAMRDFFGVVDADTLNGIFILEVRLPDAVGKTSPILPAWVRALGLPEKSNASWWWTREDVFQTEDPELMIWASRRVERVNRIRKRLRFIPFIGGLLYRAYEAWLRRRQVRISYQTYDFI